jgi:phosphopantetheinyl transferase
LQILKMKKILKKKFIKNILKQKKETFSRYFMHNLKHHELKKTNRYSQHCDKTSGEVSLQFLVNEKYYRNKENIPFYVIQIFTY